MCEVALLPEFLALFLNFQYLPIIFLFFLGGGGGARGGRIWVYSNFEEGFRKKSTKVYATRLKGSMGRSIELLHVLNTNEI